jgi:hypothetical protein
MILIFLFWLIQTFCVVAGLANAALAYSTFVRGDYDEFVLCSTVAAWLAIMVVRNQQKYIRMKREDREHAERVERLLRTTAVARAVNDSLDRGMGGLRHSPMWVYNLPQAELDECLKRGICPDCAKRSLDTMLPITCRNPQCGSRFNVDANGKWSRREREIKKGAAETAPDLR